MYRILCLFFLLFHIQLNAQQSVSFSGYVADALSKEKLIGAVVLDSAAGVHSLADNFGFFNMRLSPGVHRISVSYVGYKSFTTIFDLHEDTLVLLQLAGTTELEEITVSAEHSGRMLSARTTGLKNLPLKMIRQLPVIMGEHDLMRSLQLLPGVNPGSEANTGLYVRGGEPEHNLILLDGVEVFNPNHLFGFFSMFNDDAIKSVKMYSSGYPAQYTGRLASVIDIRTRDGNNNRLQGRATIGLFSSKIQLELDLYEPISDFNYYDSVFLNVQLHSLSHVYYQYAISNFKQHESEKDFYADPVSVYSNIEGGYGIFAGFSSSSKTIKYLKGIVRY